MLLHNNHCVTSDIDWASEDVISDFISLCEQFAVKPLLMMTHQSKVIEHALQQHKIETGIHPNFFAGSSHGDMPAEVIATCMSFAPSLLVSRSHVYFDNSIMSGLLRANGIKYDLNLCLHFQENIFPLKHASGLLRVPVFWEDDVHVTVEKGNWNTADYYDKFLSAGMKIYNFHPAHVALNTPNMEFYNSIKDKITTISHVDILNMRYKGQGVRTFFIDMMSFLKQNNSCPQSFSSLLENNTCSLGT